ncbi:MAG TPA: glycoside hydrolase family 15 protein [Bacteroidales bacterium]|nr:glycoside hydrolase family 15 protein [Bacteroidales bacterium]
MGIIGNCSYIGYIDQTTRIKWLCLPRFDSSFIFGSLLDEKKGGEFSVLPAEGAFTSSQHYLKNTNILVTEIDSKEGIYSVTDFAPRFYQYDRYFRPLMLIRKIRRISGNPRIRIRCHPVGDYGRIRAQTVRGSNHIRFLNLDAQVRLSTDIPVSYILGDQGLILTDTHYLVFTYGEALEDSIRGVAENFLDRTRAYWQSWIKATSIPDLFQEQIIRSALVLKLHQFEDSGSIIASGTTSLPEADGSGRNWDYRYCWMRDSYYTLHGFNSIGHFEEVEKYFNFIYNIILQSVERIHPLYKIAGEKVDPVRVLDLQGYRNNQPVRIGNDAILQVQNDVYGQVLISLLPLFADKRLDYYDPARTITLVKWLLDRIAATLDEPDSGIWEFGHLLQVHCYTLMFHWAGSRAAFKIASLLQDEAMMKKAQVLTGEASARIEQCYDPDRKVYTQAIGSRELDASQLQLITMHYLDPDSEKAQIHLRALEEELKTPDGLLFRYKHDERGIPRTSFLVCSFWYAEALACSGRIEEAKDLIQQLVSYANPLGLFSEDADFEGGQWGNFPQTYSHVGLINAVYRIYKRIDKPFFY